MQKPRLSFAEIFNMSFGFFGIQIGFALQGANMSRIFQTLGASEDAIPGLWLAAPLTGLLVQPVIGYMSDRTWTSFGRRKPYFFIGAVLSCIALVFMPQCSTLWMAAGGLMVLDASINISMEPFRALVGDKLPDEQRTQGFAIQSVLIGGGAFLASLLPNFFNALGVSGTAPAGVIPDTVRYAFYVGALCFMLAILYTLFKTKEYSPDEIKAFENDNKKETGNFNFFKLGMIALVQVFTWFALFAMWSNSQPAITAHVFHVTDPTTEAYNLASNQINWCWGIFNIVCAAMGFMIPSIASKIGRKFTHLLCLCLGGLGLISIYFATNAMMLFGAFILIGTAWSSILSMPYAMISSSVPAKNMGVFMGIFNMFICIPQIIASLGGLNFLTHTFIGQNAIHGILLAGILMILAGVFCLLIPDENGKDEITNLNKATN